MQVVRSVVRRHAATLRRGRPNVLRVGVGLEHVRSDDPTVLTPVIHRRARLHAHDEFVPCVQVLVSKKWRSRRQNAPSALPESLRTSVTIGKRRVAIDVPVDVIEDIPAHLHGLECSALRNDQVASGSAACLVKFGDWDEAQLLSCHHVLALSEVQPLDPTLGDVSITYQGEAIDSAVSLPGKPFNCDAALAHSPSVSWTPTPNVAALTGVLPADEDPPPVFFALTSEGERTVTFLQRAGPLVQPGYFGGKSVTFPEVIIANGQGANDVFTRGMSGAALATSDGLLVGMHFAGSGRRSLSVPMATVFAAFAMPMKLFT
jgi:hypothetical protein